MGLVACVAVSLSCLVFHDLEHSDYRSGFPRTSLPAALPGAFVSSGLGLKVMGKNSSEGHTLLMTPSEGTW